MTTLGIVANRRLRRLAFTSLIYSGCLLVAGLVSYVLLTQLLCVMAPSNRCFSTSQDALPIVRILLGPVVVMGVLVALVAYYFRRLVWWHAPVLILAALTAVGVLVLRPLATIGENIGDLLVTVIFLLIAWGVMTVGALVASIFAKSMYVTDRGA